MRCLSLLEWLLLLVYAPNADGKTHTEAQKIVFAVTTIVVGTKESDLQEGNTQVVHLHASIDGLHLDFNMLQDLLEVDLEPSILGVVLHEIEVLVRIAKSNEQVFEGYLAMDI